MSLVSRYAPVHAHPAGPGDARPTAMQIVEDQNLGGKLAGKVVFITGATSGIGYETARALLATGADLYITARDITKGNEVAHDLLRSSGAHGGHGHVFVLQLDLGSLQSVRDCAADFLSRSNKLNLLINNAGVMACPEGKTRDGFETQFGTNHLAHFFLFELLKPVLLSSSTPSFPSRVIMLSSGAHRRSPVHFDDLDLKKMGYDPWVAYGQSKTANIHMATEIERRYGSQGLHAFAVHPGLIRTPLYRHLSSQAADSVAPESGATSKSIEQGAATTVWAAIAKELENQGGQYLEDCQVAGPKTVDDGSVGLRRYAAYAFDDASAKKLWVMSRKMVGLSDSNEEVNAC